MRHEQINNDIYVYRVRQSTNHPDRRVRKAWYGRTWQAEFHQTVWAPRAYTEQGVRRKAKRWQRRGLEWRLRHARRMQWVRMHLTQRNDEHYAHLRRLARREEA